MSSIWPMFGFRQSLYATTPIPPTEEGQAWLLEVWLMTKADEHHKATRLGDAAWRVFDELCELGGTSSPSDQEVFGYNTSVAMRPQIRLLEQANLVVSCDRSVG